MRWRVCAVLLLLVFVACGKNDGIRGVGAQPYPPPVVQAPPPPGGGYAPPPPGYMPPPMPQYPNPNYQPPAYWVPTLPPGRTTPRYTPFLPIDNYMRRTPQRHQRWIDFWAGWQGYSRHRGYDEYDFNHFWFEYCPEQWEGTDYAHVYNQLDASVYFWVDMYTPIAPTAEPNHFWQYYSGMPYGDLDSYCQYGCY